MLYLFFAQLVTFLVSILHVKVGVAVGIVVTVLGMAISWKDKPSTNVITLVGMSSALATLLIHRGLGDLAIVKQANVPLFVFLLGVTMIAAGSRPAWQAIAYKLPVAWASVIVTLTAGFLSGILDGVSVIGILLTVFLVLRPGIEGAMIASIVTSVGGFWAAWGEPPNLIMKFGLGIGNQFFLGWLGIPAFVTTLWLAWCARDASGLSRTDPEHAKVNSVSGTQLIPVGVFIALLLAHASYPGIPLWITPWCGILVATIIGLVSGKGYLSNAARLGFGEWKGYLFLAPFFVQAACVRELGALDWLRDLLSMIGTHPTVGVLAVFVVTVFLGAMLDSSSVAQILVLSFHGLLFTESLRGAIIAAGLSGFAIGGAMTPIGSMQSAVTNQFLVDRGYRVPWGLWFSINIRLLIIPILATVCWILLRLHLRF